jgi:hypothetical protein
MILALGKNLTARGSFLLILSAIVNDGLQVACIELIDVLVMGVMKAADDLDGTRLVQPRLGMHDFHVIPAVISSRRGKVFYHHIPGLAPTSAPQETHPWWASPLA